MFLFTVATFVLKDIVVYQFAMKKIIIQRNERVKDQFKEGIDSVPYYSEDEKFEVKNLLLRHIM